MKEITEGTAEQVMAHVREVLPHAYPGSVYNDMLPGRALKYKRVTEELVIHTNLFRVGDTDSWVLGPHQALGVSGGLDHDRT